MSSKEILLDLLVLFDELQDIINNKKWANYSATRIRILINQKLDEIKHTLSGIPMEVFSLLGNEELTNFFDQVLEKVTVITSNMNKQEHLIEWFELEVIRLNYASMYASMWGQGGALQVIGTAQAMTHALIGIQTLDVEGLFISDWKHPDFYKRKKLILNYLSSAVSFFFTLCDTLNFIHKFDLLNWLDQACKSAELFLKYTELYWDVPKSIELDKKYRKFEGKPNYSPYYATFAILDNIIIALVSLQRYFFDYSINVQSTGEMLNFSNTTTFFESLDRLMEKATHYVSDFKEHVRKGLFGFNEDPLEDPNIKETIHQLDLTKVYIKGNFALYRIIYEDVHSELHLLEEIVLPAFFEELERYKDLMKSEEFEQSHLADGMNMMLETILFYAGIYALKKDDFSFIEKVEKEYAFFFEEEKLARYPNLNGFYYLLKTTFSLRSSDFSDIQKYSKNLILLSKHSVYEVRNSLSYAILGYMLNMLAGQITKNQFLDTLKEKFDELYLAFPPDFQSEIEIYFSYLNASLANENMAIDMSRLAEPKHYDSYSIFIPDVSKYAKEKGFNIIIYLPFNLKKDYIVRSYATSSEEELEGLESFP